MAFAPQIDFVLKEISRSYTLAGGVYMDIEDIIEIVVKSILLSVFSLPEFRRAVRNLWRVMKSYFK